jgi:hypothetical protein
VKSFLRYVKDVSRFLKTAVLMPGFCALLFVTVLSSRVSGASPEGAAMEPLQAYQGTWQVTRSDSGAHAQPERLTNRCLTLGIYFACEQRVNGKPTALLVFLSTDQPGHYHTQSILPEGRATGLDDLQISGNRWTFTSRRHQGGDVTYFQNTNVFTDANHIHFENAQSPNGKQWTVQESGDEVRVAR